MPKLWNATIEAHRRDVRDAVQDAAAALVAEHGLRSVTMSRVAVEAGIGRATLYKYFPDVEAILIAWHERQIARHLELLVAAGSGAGDAGTRLAAALAVYALILHRHHGTELAALLHDGEHVAQARGRLSDFLRDLLSQAAAAGELRDDVPPDELAGYCLHAVTAAVKLPSEAAVRRLVQVILAGLRRQA